MFELLADDVAEVSWGDVESVEGTYFWGLEVCLFPGGMGLASGVGWWGRWTHGTVPVSVKRKNALTSLCWICRGLCDSG